MLHHSASYQAIHPLYQQQMQAQQQQHMMYHAKSYESGIGMYGNYVLDSFPNRYHHYLRATHASPERNDDPNDDDNQDLTNKNDAKKPTNKHQHHRTKTAAIAANRVYSDLNAHQHKPSNHSSNNNTSSSQHNSTSSNGGRRHHHHHNKKTVNIAPNHTKNPLYVSTADQTNNHPLYGYHTRPLAGGALYDHLPRPRCVTCQCNCSTLPPHGLQRWGSESDIASIHQRHEDFSIDSIDMLALSQHYPTHMMDAFYAPRIIPNRGGSLHMPVYPFYQNHYCHQPPQLMSPNPYSTYYGDEIEDAASVSYRLRKTASNESFFGYPIDTVVSTTTPPPLPPPARRLPQIALGRRFKPRGASAVEKRRVKGSSKDSGRETSSEQRSIYTGSVSGVGEPVGDDYSESLYGFFKQRKNSKDLRAEYAQKA